MATTARIITETDAWAHPALGFVEPEVVPDAGYWRVFKGDGCTSSLGTSRKSKSFCAHQRASVVADLKGVSDVYVTQNYFTRRRCRGDHVQAIPGAWIDLDIYRHPELMEWPLPAMVRELLAHCDARSVPRPSYTIASGRGLYLKWSFTRAAGGDDTATCVAINKALARLFAAFGADSSATDSARILRPVGSVNGKSGRTVHVAHREETANGTPIRHDMATLQAAAIAAAPSPPGEPKASGADAPRKAHPTAPRGRLAAVPPTAAGTSSGRGWKGWNARVLADITRLADLRWPNALIPEGWRDRFAFHAAVQIAHLEGADQIMPVLRTWAAPRLPRAFIADKLDSYMQSLCDRAQREQRGETVEYQPEPDGPVVEMSPIYTFGRATLLDRLAITSAESRHLDVLIHDGDRRARDRARKAQARRAHGCRTTAERAAERAAEADREGLKIEALRARGRSWAEIAAALGITAGAARQRLKRLHERRAGRGKAAGHMVA